MVILPYKFGSRSAKALAAAIGIKRTRRILNRNSTINWGSGNPALTLTLNMGSAVAVAGNKLRALLAMKEAGVPVVEFTQDREEAELWLTKGNTVYARTLLRSSQGKGIAIANKAEGLPLVPAPLYTKYAKNKHEYRVHVVNGVAIYMQKKLRRRGVEAMGRIRNADNGWVYCYENIVVPDSVKAAGIQAVGALHLDFGAVDIGYRERDGAVFVFEVNTAPGITGSTITAYVKAIRGVYDGQ